VNSQHGVESPLVNDAPNDTDLTPRAAEGVLGLARRCSVDIPLLLTDKVMPGLSGHDLAPTLIVLRPRLRKPFTLEAITCKAREACDAA
jgi:hypothetical protein